MAKTKEVRLLVTTQVIENGAKVYKMAGETAIVDEALAKKLLGNKAAEEIISVVAEKAE